MKRILLGAALLLCVCCSKDQAQPQERSLEEIVKSAHERQAVCNCSTVFTDPDCLALVAYFANPHRHGRVPPYIAGVCDPPLKCPKPERSL